MNEPRVLMIAPEIFPFAKTGGLADVTAALSGMLARLGVRVAATMPLYAAVRKETALHETGFRFPVPVGSEIHEARIYEVEHPAGGFPVYLVRGDEFFDRPGLYGESGADHPDNSRRFTFFARAAVDLACALDPPPAIIHAHDWQAALVPVYWKLDPDRASRAATVLTIHDLAFQGRFPAHTFADTGLPPELFDWEALEFWGDVSFLKGGLVFADALTTVSPRYAAEIQANDGSGCGLAGVLRARASDLVGILNGIDTSVWSPDGDPKIPARYGAEDLRGKEICKRVLQDRLGLPVREIPLLGMVSRLDPQKGFEILFPAIEDLLAQEDVQFVVLGTGRPEIADRLLGLARDFPQKARAIIAFDDALAHGIEAGADIYLMPSRYEPAGQNQLISMRYGTIPVVRETGGLADSVRQVTQETLADGTATGFVFAPERADVLAATVREALRWHRDREAWMRIQRNGMTRDWGWEGPARQYLDLYRSLLARKEPRP